MREWEKTKKNINQLLLLFKETMNRRLADLVFVFYRNIESFQFCFLYLSVLAFNLLLLQICWNFA
jgi:hypothetical protein